MEEIVAPATYVPPMSPLDMSIALQRTEVGNEMLELIERSPLDIITETFENDRVRALLLYASCMWGLDPRETGTGFFVPLLLTRGMNKCYCYGGSHKFASALNLGAHCMGLRVWKVDTYRVPFLRLISFTF
ncbi:unnamed protein product [marine sediment metagenome]|uniref:Uncharacterized protein n=1 Tax=marine sediment metagenome TaxID=412755 RepID=X1UUR9_9ZZZZ